MPRDTWVVTDPRDSEFDRTFHLYRLDEIDRIRGGHHCVVYALSHPDGRQSAADVIDRWVTTDVRTLTRQLADLFAGKPVVLADKNGHADPDLAANLKHRVALHARDGRPHIAFAIHYSDQIAPHPKPPIPPTDDMMARVRGIMSDEGWNGLRWQSATRLEDLPCVPHDSMLFALLGVDSRGRIHDCFPKPPQNDLDRHFGRNLPALVRAIRKHPSFADTRRFVESRGWRLLYAWRPRGRAAA